MKRLLQSALVVIFTASYAYSGDVKGTVKFSGSVPKGAPIQMSADPICKKAHRAPVMSEEVVVSKGGGLANVMVYVTAGLKGKQATPKEVKLFDQIGCVYTPHVLTISTNQEVEIRNSDPTLHNVHSLSKKNASFNQAQPMKGMKMKKKFTSEEYFKVKCEVHPWMGAYIGVFDHPFHTVTADDGTFTIEGLPAGDYTIEVKHEKYGTQSAKVKVDASGTATVDFSFKG